MYNTSPKILDLRHTKKQTLQAVFMEVFNKVFSTFIFCISSVRFVLFPANMLPIAAGNYFTLCFVNYLVILTALILTCTMFSLLKHLIEADTISEFRGVNNMHQRCQQTCCSRTCNKLLYINFFSHLIFCVWRKTEIVHNYYNLDVWV